MQSAVNDESYKMGLIFSVCDEFICDHPNETSLAARKEGTICFSALLKMKFGTFATILGVKGRLRLVISVRSFHR